jgi:photosystem II stability/assembly factor-like uncharacterized protein
MNRPSISRRTLLAAACAACAPTFAAPYQADGPARVRPLAARGVLLDLTLAGARVVAVGERGHVLLSDDQGKSWRQARTVPTRTTLTAIHATTDRQLWAAGHGGVILASSDAGETWTLASGKADGPDVLLAIRVQADGQGLAVGGFGIALATADGGKSWKGTTLVEGETGERHLNRIVVSAAGSWLIAAEGGHVLRSSGAPGSMTWSAIKTPYAGSLWTGMALPSGGLLFGGMRGNLVRSSDDGRTWTHLPVPTAGSFTGCVALADGRPLLVGVDGTVVIGDAGASAFTLRRLDDRSTLTGVVQLPGGALVAGGTAGMRPLELSS